MLKRRQDTLKPGLFQKISELPVTDYLGHSNDFVLKNHEILGLLITKVHMNKKTVTDYLFTTKVGK